MVKLMILIIIILEIPMPNKSEKKNKYPEWWSEHPLGRDKVDFRKALV